jgi:hypothetical protein
MDLPPVQVMALDYDGADSNPWSAVVRLMALTAGAQGVTHALGSSWQVAQFSLQVGSPGRVDLRQGVGLALQLGSAAAGVGLAAAGWLAFRRRAVGRHGIVWLELALALLAVAQAVQSIWQWTQIRGIATARMWPYMVGTALYLPGAFVLPALLWLFFRQPEVRTSFGEVT